jgi:hypothetical protein
MSEPPRRRRRSRALRSATRLNPFSRITEKLQPDERLADAIRVVGAYREHLQDDRIAWFGWPLKDDVQDRYIALGFHAEPELGLVESRGFVADVVSGHLVWERSIEDRWDVPRRVSDLVRG